MNPRIEQSFPITEEDERCPSCGHAWEDRGPAHFADCRYFSMDDDRDEDRSGFVWNRKILSLRVPSAG